MLEIIKGDNGELKAVCEYYIVDADGHFDNFGEFVWVNDVYIDPRYRNNGILKSFAKTIMDRVPHATFGYFWRQGKYPGRKFRMYHKARWIKLLGGVK